MAQPEADFVPAAPWIKMPSASMCVSKHAFSRLRFGNCPNVLGASPECVGPAAMRIEHRPEFRSCVDGPMAQHAACIESFRGKTHRLGPSTEGSPSWDNVKMSSIAIAMVR